MIPGASEDLPVGTRVMVTAPTWGVAVGVVVARDKTVPGFGAGVYDVRTDSGTSYFCLPFALFDLRCVATRPAICIARQAGHC